MLSSSDYNSAVPQFTNGNYASNPINPLYIEEPDAVDYNRGTEPLETLPAQWWNWFGNQFTSRFNKLNIYVRNIFNELTQLLSLVNMSPDGTEETPTINQLKTTFETKYPKYLALIMYPVGSLYWTGKAPDDGGDPNTLFGGTWVQIKGKFIFAKGDSDTLNATGGSKTVTLTTEQIPSHNHTFTGTAHNHTFTGSEVTSGANNRGHTHSVTASGSISGGAYKFTGSAVTSGTESAHESFSGSASHSHNVIFSGEPSTRYVYYFDYQYNGYAGVGNGLGQLTTHNNATGYIETDSRTVSISGTCTGDHTHSVTASGSVSVTTNPTFTGSAVTSGGESQNHTHKVTASGTIGNTTATGTIGNTGGGQPHENMPPYVVKYCWERTA